MNVLIQAGPASQCADAMKKSIDEILETMHVEQFAKAAQGDCAMLGNMRNLGIAF